MCLVLRARWYWQRDGGSEGWMLLRDGELKPWCGMAAWGSKLWTLIIY